jgi:membrane protein DedA with SNARE-associated domain
MANVFELLESYCQTYGYPILFGGVMLENAGLPVPGETAVIVGGFLASEGGGRIFALPVVIPLVIVAAVLGDNLGFWLGRRYARPRLQSGRRFLFLTRRSLEMAEAYFLRYGSWTIFVARFITGLRVVGALAAGTAGMPWPRFLLANASGAVVWASTFSLLGFFFGNNYHVLEAWLGRGGLIVLGCLVVAGLILWHLRRFRRKVPVPETPQGHQLAGASGLDEIHGH